MVEIKIIGEENKMDINIPNEPFSLFGRMMPSYMDGRWDYSIEKFDKVSEMCFPDENYDFEEMAVNSIFIGGYDKGNCIGLAILQQAFFKYMYLYDLKVNREYRRYGIGAKLIEEAKKVAVLQGYRGIYTQGQDNNLGACLFYINNGFYIGGFDTCAYKGTKQEGKADIIFYLDCENLAENASCARF